MEASGLGSWQKMWPMAVGGGVASDDLSMLLFDFKDFAGFSVDATDDEMQQDIRLTSLLLSREGGICSGAVTSRYCLLRRRDSATKQASRLLRCGTSSGGA
jgi:hypothetical protein